MAPEINFTERLAQEFNWSLQGIRQAVQLLEDGNTIPFIARYRKEATGEMDEETLRRLAERLEYLQNLAKRQEEVVRLIGEQGKLTAELEKEIMSAETLQVIEDLYRPFRPKRTTRASVAREKGLEPLARLMADQNLSKTKDNPDIAALALEYINPDLEVNTVEEALAGARDILAEETADDPGLRGIVRELISKRGLVVTKALLKEEEFNLTPYAMYAEYQEPLRTILPHRILALNRGEKEDALQVKLDLPVEEIISKLWQCVLTNPASLGAEQVKEAVADGIRRLLLPSLEREIRKQLTEKAEEQAIMVFSRNLRSLLLQPPVRGQVVLGIDPGFRTGCKLAVVNDTGKLLEIGVIYPHPPQKQEQAARQKVQDLLKKWPVTAIAIGNGTASRETEVFVANFLKEEGFSIKYTIVSEAGASVYSASKLAREEFPDLDLSYRSGVSIARRVQDPLAELVKIDPQSIGVGQYQHDVNVKQLSQALEGVVESCVNTVGVELNTASPALLQYVAGLSPSVARAIVAKRESKGKYRLRKELLSVSRLGERTFQQCSGFLRIAEGDNPLENTPVHPESYQLAEQILSMVGFKGKDLLKKETEIREALKELDYLEVAQELGAGIPTVKDIIKALQRPGRDPREDWPPVLFRQDVLSLEDLTEGMILTGIVRNVVDFGAFVDIGVKQDGLIHLSELSNKFIKHPLEVLAVGDVVKVRVLQIDKNRGRIGLTMKNVE